LLSSLPAYRVPVASTTRLDRMALHTQFRRETSRVDERRARWAVGRGAGPRGGWAVCARTGEGGRERGQCQCATYPPVDTDHRRVPVAVAMANT
jgi:hypothetical protein